MTRRRTIAAAAFASFVCAAATISAQGPREHDPQWAAPLTASALPNPLTARREMAAGGRKVFEQRCANCHGPEGKGTTQAPALATLDVQTQSDGALFWKISTGNTRGGMPDFSFLPVPQRWQVVLHLRTFAAPSNAVAPNVSPISRE